MSIIKLLFNVYKEAPLSHAGLVAAESLGSNPYLLKKVFNSRVRLLKIRKAKYTNLISGNNLAGSLSQRHQ